MLQQINRQLEKCMPAITPISVIIGVILTDSFKSYSYLVPWIFAFMTFAGSLSSNFKSLRQVISHPLPMLTALLILHVIMPAWAWGIGHLIFSKDMFTVTGLILAVMIPTGITSFIWISIYKGNIALALSLILIDTFLSPFIVPYSLSLFVGEKIVMDVFGMMKGLFGMVVIPSILGMFLNELTAGKVKETLGTKLAPVSKVGLAAVVMINSSIIAPHLSHIDGKLILIAVVVFGIASSGYLFSWLISSLFKWGRDDTVTLVFTGGMRNISAGAVLAVSYFPAPVAVPVVIGMLFQQVLASLYGYMLHKVYAKKDLKNSMVTEYIPKKQVQQ